MNDFLENYWLEEITDIDDNVKILTESELESKVRYILDLYISMKINKDRSEKLKQILDDEN